MNKIILIGVFLIFFSSCNNYKLQDETFIYPYTTLPIMVVENSNNIKISEGEKVFFYLYKKKNKFYRKNTWN